ncbi:deoxynucleotide monophosphate kinase [Pseudaminobacter arsenicus]|uniref:Deoxynucleotide monophosphate kinase n=1 Tax=Borborobacter arsenicus TaxID=1851146 RepID=A0A432VAD4_9HYPH|nr:deoxynucleotide monophosphate kinase [Pseudaminobacter arsenicus]RUM99053.1 deoxynucleotide monophosphate kinase [Pseudaminobacter arsenicus]
MTPTNTAAWSPWGRQPLAANDNLPRVVAFTGVAGSGKSTAADYLTSKGYTRIKFAGPLKAMCRAVGLSDEHIEGDLKERPLDWLQGKSPRQFMQRLGTEFGRDCIGPHFWVGLWERAALEVLDEGGRVVCDDCRFANEADAVRKLGGVVVRLAGRGGLAGGHASESVDWEADAMIGNHHGIDRLRENLDWVMREVAA